MQIKRIVNVRYGLAATVLLLTFIIYLPSLGNEFVGWDDDKYIFDNPYIRSFNMPFLKWAFFDFYAANWHPLTWISHAMDYALWGLNPLGHHLTSNVLHAANCGLAYAKSGLFSNAIDSFDTFIEMNPNYGEAYLSRGKVYLETGNRARALSDFQKACSLRNEGGCKALHDIGSRL